MGEARRRKLREAEELISSTSTATTDKIYIIKPHQVKSKRVKSYSQIRRDVKEMKVFVKSEFTVGLFKEAYSLAHCEVEKCAYAFFVVNPELTKKNVFKHNVMINPIITDIPKTIKFKADKDNEDHENNMEVREACMMFPHRKPKRLDRPYRIKVKYQVPFFFGLFLKTIRETFEGLQSQVFQHSVEHIEGRNIFFKS